MASSLRGRTWSVDVAPGCGAGGAALPNSRANATNGLSVRLMLKLAEMPVRYGLNFAVSLSVLPWKQSGADAVSPALGGDAGVARMAVRLRKLLGALEIVRK